MSVISNNILLEQTFNKPESVKIELNILYLTTGQQAQYIPATKQE